MSENSGELPQNGNGDNAAASGSDNSGSENDEFATASMSSSSVTNSSQSERRQYFVRSSPTLSRSPSASSQYSSASENASHTSDEFARSSNMTSDDSPEGESARRRRRLRRDEDKKYDTTPFGMRPKHKWNAVLEINKFVMNGKSRKYQRRFYGSLRNAQRLELMATLEGHTGCVNSVSFNETGRFLASGSDDLSCMVWDWQCNRLMIAFPTGHRNNVFQTKFMPNKNDRIIISTAREGSVRLHELSECGTHVESSRKIAYHRGAVHKVAMHPAIQETVMSSGEDGCVYEIDLRMPNPSTLVTVKDSRDRPIGLYSIAINPTKPYEFVTAGTDCFVRLFDRRNAKPECVRKLCPSMLVNHRNSQLAVSCATYNFDGTEILATYSDEDIYIFNNCLSAKADEQYLKKYQGHRNNQTIKSVNYFGLRSEYIVSGSDCGHIFLWDKETRHIVNFLYGDEGGVVNVLEPNPVAPYLATSGFDPNVKIWAPSADEEAKLDELRSHTIENIRQREMDTDMDEFATRNSDRSQLLLYLMDILPSRHAHRIAPNILQYDSSTDDEAPNPRGQCPPS